MRRGTTVALGSVQGQPFQTYRAVDDGSGAAAAATAPPWLQNAMPPGALAPNQNMLDAASIDSRFTHTDVGGTPAAALRGFSSSSSSSATGAMSAPAAGSGMYAVGNGNGGGGVVARTRAPQAYGPYRHGQQVQYATNQSVRAGQSVPASLATQAAKLMQEQKAAMADACGSNGTKVVVLDFCSRNTDALNVASNDREQQRNAAARPTGGNTDGTMGSLGGTVGTMSTTLPDNITIIHEHRLLHAQIVSYEMSALLRQAAASNHSTNGSNLSGTSVAAGGSGLNSTTSTSASVYANASAMIGGEEQYALCVTEQFVINQANRVVDLVPGRVAIEMPFTSTSVGMLLHVAPWAAAELNAILGCSNGRRASTLATLFGGAAAASCRAPVVSSPGGASDHDDLYVVCFRDETNQHGFVTGLVFYLLVGEAMEVHTLVSPCATGEGDAPVLRFGASTPCFETIACLDDTRILCRLLGVVSGGQGIPRHQPFLDNIHALAVATTGLSATGRGTIFGTDRHRCHPYGSDSENDPIVACAEAAPWLYWTYTEALEAVSRLTAHSGVDDAPFSAVYRPSAPPSESFVQAYVPPATTPHEVASYVMAVVRILRASRNLEDPDMAHTLGAIEDVRYDASTDTYRIHVRGGDEASGGPAGDLRVRSLLVPPSPVNFPLRRVAMLTSENAPAAKEAYLNASLSGVHWMAVKPLVPLSSSSSSSPATTPVITPNTTPLVVTLLDTASADPAGGAVRITAAIPTGEWRLQEFAMLLQAALQQAVARDAGMSALQRYQFEVSAALCSVNRAQVFADRWSRNAQASRTPPSYAPPPASVQAILVPSLLASIASSAPAPCATTEPAAVAPSCTATSSASSSSSVALFSGAPSLQPLHNDPYDVQAFAISIRNVAPVATAGLLGAFTLHWSQNPALAALVDAEQRDTTVGSDTAFAWVNRLFASTDVAVASREIHRWQHLLSMAEAQPRASYRAYVDAQSGTSTLEQALRQPIVAQAMAPPPAPPQPPVVGEPSPALSSPPCGSPTGSPCGCTSPDTSSSCACGDNNDDCCAEPPSTCCSCTCCPAQETAGGGGTCACGCTSSNGGGPCDGDTPRSTIAAGGAGAATSTTTTSASAADVAGWVTVAPDGVNWRFPNARASLPFVPGDVVWVTCGGTTIGVPVSGCALQLMNDGRVVRTMRLRAQCGLWSRAVPSPQQSLSSPPAVFVLQPSPVGFNLHWHVAAIPPQSNSREDSVSTHDASTAQWPTVARWLGFRPFTRMTRRTYTGDVAPGSLLDEWLLLYIPELCSGVPSERRETHFSQTTPFDDVLSEHYAVLVLDRPRGVYRYDVTYAASLLTNWSIERLLYAALQALGSSEVRARGGGGGGSSVLERAAARLNPGSGMNDVPDTLTFQLTRPDGTPYTTDGYPLVASLELIYE